MCLSHLIMSLRVWRALGQDQTWHRTYFECRLSREGEIKNRNAFLSFKNRHFCTNWLSSQFYLIDLSVATVMTFENDGPLFQLVGSWVSYWLFIHTSCLCIMSFSFSQRSDWLVGWLTYCLNDGSLFSRGIDGGPGPELGKEEAGCQWRSGSQMPYFQIWGGEQLCCASRQGRFRFVMWS